VDKPVTTEQPSAALVEVTIIVDNHQHQGKPCEQGDKIKVTAEERDWLANLKIIKK
jgi:hypothetical protein